MGNGEWGLEAGDWDWGMENREPIADSRKPGLGTGDTGLESRELIADSRCGNQLSAYRLPLSEFAYYFFQMI